MTRSIWTEDAIRIFHERYNAGDTYAAISSAIIGSTEAGVTSRIVRETRAGRLVPRVLDRKPEPPDVWPRLKEMATTGMTNLAISMKIGRTKAWVDWCAWKFPFRAPTASVWTEERELELENFVKVEQLTAGAIAKRMKVTRNTIMGKCRRKGWVLATPACNAGGKNPRSRENMGAPPKKRPVPVVRVFESRPEPEFDPTITGLTLMELERDSCRWPVTGGSVDTVFCGQGAVENCPYCARHRKMAWTGERVVGNMIKRAARRAA